ncbi:SAM-dependent methyltransferase [Methanobrevibacter sp. YE315]|uniref:methyltransferase domain-containing protein n=1 Tax=Methanobrevibacter sp. YE315 TaxID=1609968 RepID=UPI000764E52A|nr:methyltransferase domain-containing protein [Methanobrevibacter sp. YE315]AMD17114.1 SAM-dependent methyltransferase [Methanobrevibacter sp. YE315]
MKFKTTPYHLDLLKDEDRLSAFFEAISEYDGNTDLAYDLGCGSGVLSYFLKDKFDEIISIEINKKTYDCAKDNLAVFDNIEVVNSDVLEYEFTKKADLIVCEMLDTALIDEEEVPILNHVRKFLKKNGKIIPQGIINTAELVNLERHNIHWDEGVNYEVFSKPLVFCELDFLDEINPEVEVDMSLKATKEGLINGLKITSFTKLNDNLIVGPLPMLNPPLLIPLDEKEIKVNDLINVNLKYIMGNGIESIQTQYY